MFFVSRARRTDRGTNDTPNDNNMFVTYIREASESDENNKNQKKATSKQCRKRATLNTKNSKNGSESGRRNKNSNTFKNNKNNNNKFTNEEKYDYVSNNDLGRSSTEQSMTVTEARNDQLFEQGGPRKRGSDSFGSLRDFQDILHFQKYQKARRILLLVKDQCSTKMYFYIIMHNFQRD